MLRFLFVDPVVARREGRGHARPRPGRASSRRPRAGWRRCPSGPRRPSTTRCSRSGRSWSCRPSRRSSRSAPRSPARSCRRRCSSRWSCSAGSGRWSGCARPPGRPERRGPAPGLSPSDPLPAGARKPETLVRLRRPLPRGRRDHEAGRGRVVQPDRGPPMITMSVRTTAAAIVTVRSGESAASARAPGRPRPAMPEAGRCRRPRLCSSDRCRGDLAGRRTRLLHAQRREQEQDRRADRVGERQAGPARMGRAGGSLVMPTIVPACVPLERRVISHPAGEATRPCRPRVVPGCVPCGRRVWRYPRERE